MTYRPKQNEKEEDLFRLQNAMATGQLPSSGVHLVKRKGETDTDIDDTKRLRRKQREEEDVETMMDVEDRHVTVVLSKIQERAPTPHSSGPAAGPLAGPTGSPRVLRLESTDGPPADRRSLFARQMDRLRVGSSSVQPVAPPGAPSHAGTVGATMPSRLVTGAGLGGAFASQEKERIHRENLQRLEGLPAGEIEKERERLLQELDPSLVAFLMRGSPQNAESRSSPPSVDKGVKWRSAEDVEKQKLAWMQEVKLPEASDGQTQARFDFNGDVVPIDAPVPVQEGLHHHGDEAERAGYTPGELFTLARSANLRQRQLALRTLARCCAAARSGRHLTSLQAPLLPDLCRAGLPFLLRWAADDASDAAALTAVTGLASLLCDEKEEEDEEEEGEWIGRKPQGHSKAEDEEETDLQLMQRDLILGLLRTDLLQRLAYLTEKMAPRWEVNPGEDAEAFSDLLRLLIALTRHSRAAAQRVATHRRLLRALLPLCAVLQERKRLALRLQRYLCKSSAAICRNQCRDFNLLTDVLQLVSDPESSDQLKVESLKVLTIFLNHVTEVPAISSRGHELEAALRKAMACSPPGLPVLTAWVSFVRAAVRSLRAFPKTQWLEGLVSTGEELCAQEVGRFANRLETERLSLLASCLSCVGCMLELQEGRHPSFTSLTLGALAAKWHERIAAVLAAPSFRTFLQDLKPNSWLLLAREPGQTEVLLPHGLLSRGSALYKRQQDGTVTRHAPRTRPFGVLAALCRMLALRGANATLARTLLCDSGLRRYLRALISCRMGPELQGFPLWWSELRALTDLLRLVARQDPPEDPPLWLALTLHLLPLLHPSQGATARHLITRIVFAPAFADLTMPCGLTERLDRLDLQESSPTAVIEDLQRHLATAASTYLDLIPSPSSTADDEPCARLMPPDWPYLPLIRLHQREEDETQNEDIVAEQRRSLLQCLRLLSFLELSSRKTGLPLNLGPAGHLVRLFSFFLRCGDLFLEQIPGAHLSWQLKAIAEKKVEPAEVEVAAREIFTSFADLYSAVLKEYFAISYGCPTFSSFVLLPASVRFPAKLRLALWREGREGLRMMRMKPAQCVFDVRDLLEDDPKDPELLRLQAESLLSGALEPSSLLFLVALHAINRALFVHAPSGTPRHRFQGLVARAASTELAKQLFFYKDFAEEMTFYSELPPIRATYLNALLQQI